MPIKVILILGLLALTLFGAAITRNRTATRLLLLVQLLLGVLLVLFPELTQVAAEVVGVGRGTDLLLYLLVLAVYFGAIVFMAKCRRMERQLTTAVRECALLREELARMKRDEAATAASGGGQDDGR